MPITSGVRFSGQERRTQLVSLGLTMLEARPFHSLSVDDVAAEAGISRSLLFHYFPTKTDYLVAVVRAATEHLLSLTEVPEHVTSDDRTRSMIAAFVRYVQSRRTNYVAVIRCAPAVDPRLEFVVEEMRDTLCRRILASAHTPDRDHAPLLAARVWLAGVEELALLTPDELASQQNAIDFAVEAFRGLLGSRLLEDHLLGTSIRE